MHINYYHIKNNEYHPSIAQQINLPKLHARRAISQLKCEEIQQDITQMFEMSQSVVIL